MANPFTKGWKYLMASFDSKIDQNADPKVQIKQAADAAQQQHRDISNRAAEIIGNEKQLQMKLDRLLKSQQELQEKTRTALQLADKATAEGDQTKASEYNQTAEVLASQLVSVETEVENTSASLKQAQAASEQARRQQQESEARLKEQMAQVQQLESQAEQAAMQEKTTAAMGDMHSVGGDDNVPTLDGVRDKIERRYANALGAQELAKDSTADRMAEIATSGTDVKAASRLEEIRQSMALDSGASNGAGRGTADKQLDAPKDSDE